MSHNILRAYDRNANFRGVPVNLPEPLEPQWPLTGFQQLRPEHKIMLPKLTTEQIEGYFLYRMAEDRQASGDIKALEKGKKMFESHRILACSFYQSGQNTFLSGIVGAAMRHKVTYNYKIKIDRCTGEPLNSHCECPAGKGPHGTCKHIAAVMMMLMHFIQTGDVQVEKCCTENLQTFHKPKAFYNGSPVKTQNIPSKRKHLDSILDDPRPAKFQNLKGYNDHVRNSLINFCSTSSMDISLRYIYPKADLQNAVHDHDYLERPFAEYWIDNALKVTENDCKAIEKCTRKQSKCNEWFRHRKWRLTASRFGEITRMTCRRNKNKLCKTLINSHKIVRKCLLHGKQFESKAICKFEVQKGVKCRPSGLFVRPDFPFLGASPDGIVDGDFLIEVKCPYNGRNDKILPGKCFPFLYRNKSGEIALKEISTYYAQIQGQLFIAKRKYCYFIVYTFVDLFVQVVDYDENFCLNSLVPKLSMFYEKYFRPYLASLL
ncbi:unnamed protein product [Mytilus edulis]|uniref:SWIM-type domain-containing protein n=2 Tax=Mytilus edulis TaxID=6550 RepID=A0A8S3R802_MYTED|nr:unnamed protein product [Mytilus edulis]